MSSPSPMTTPLLFDRLVLITSKGQRLVLPGVPMLKVTRQPRDEPMDGAGQTGQVVTHFGDDTAEVTVEFTMSSAAQYREFVALLKVLRVKNGEPLVYTAVHPVLQAHGIRQVRHVRTQDSGYTPMQGYKASLDFTEYYKPKQTPVVQTGTERETDDATGANSTPPTPPVGATPPNLTNVGPKGSALYKASLTGLLTGPKEPGLCSAWCREAYQGKYGAFPGASRALFGKDAKETSQNFQNAGLRRDYSQVGFAGLKPGDLIFYDADRSGFGHVGIYQGNGMVAGNDLLSYRQGPPGGPGGLFDPRTGSPTGFDKNGNKASAIGVQSIDALGKPTGVGRLDGWAGSPTSRPFIGPTLPFKPSVTPPLPPKGPPR